MSDIQQTEEWFNEHYTPVTNHIDGNAGWEGKLFETYGEEIDFVIKQDPAKIWTWVDGSEGDYTILTSGYHLVNRIGYIITAEPVPEGAIYEIKYDSEGEG